MSNNQAIGQDDPNEEGKKEQEKEINELKKKMEEKETLIRGHESHLSGLRSNGLQLINIYLVFQGVILTATASGAKVFRCNDSWLLITISILAACPNLAALYLIGHEYIGIISQQDKWLIDWDKLNTKLYELNNARPQPDPTTRTPPPEQTPTTGGTTQRRETSGPQLDPVERTPPPEQTPTTDDITQRGETSSPQPDPVARTLPHEQTLTIGGTTQLPPELTLTTGGTTQRGETSGPQPDPVARTPPPKQTHTPGGTTQRGETSAGTPRGDNDYWIKCKRIVFLFGCMTFFFGVSAIMGFACRKILCRPVAGCKLPSSFSKNCIRLCDEGRSKCLTICGT